MVTGSIYCGIYFNGFYYVYKSDRLHIPLVLSILMIKRGMLHVLYNLCNNFLTEKFGIIYSVEMIHIWLLATVSIKLCTSGFTPSSPITVCSYSCENAENNG